MEDRSSSLLSLRTGSGISISETITGERWASARYVATHPTELGRKSPRWTGKRGRSPDGAWRNPESVPLDSVSLHPGYVALKRLPAPFDIRSPVVKTLPTPFAPPYCRDRWSTLGQDDAPRPAGNSLSLRRQRRPPRPLDRRPQRLRFRKDPGIESRENRRTEEGGSDKVTAASGSNRHFQVLYLPQSRRLEW